jgi:hypothetical protein
MLESKMRRNKMAFFCLFYHLCLFEGFLVPNNGSSLPPALNIDKKARHALNIIYVINRGRFFNFAPRGEDPLFAPSFCTSESVHPWGNVGKSNSS